MPEPTEVNDLSASQKDAVIAVQGAENVDVIPQDNGLFTVQIRFEDPPPAPADPGWSTAPAMDQKDFHSKFDGQEWKYDSTGVFLHGSATPERSGGSPITCATIVSLYANELLKASRAHGVPPELIVMTIAIETGSNRGSNFTGPKTFRWEPGVTLKDVQPPRKGDYSAGPMQTIATTARGIIRNLHMHLDPFVSAPALASKPVPPPAENPLYEAGLSIDLGTAVIASNLARTGFDPILVAACYNHGSLGPSNDNPWHLFTTGDHLNRAAEWYGDACAVIGPLRAGSAVDANIVKSPKLNATPVAPAGVEAFELSQLTKATADEEVDFYTDAGATVQLINNGGGLFTVRVQFGPPPPAGQSGGPPSAGQTGGPAPPVAAGNTPAPTQDGYVIVLNRIRTERRAGKVRTVGFYQAYFDRQPIAGIAGMAAEQAGPGDNTLNGRARKARIAAGLYPLFTHASGVGPGGVVKYRTFGFSKVISVKARAWPAVRVGNTNNRAGILIHCAGGFMMSAGCVNLASGLQNASSDINFTDSHGRVIALIDSMKSRLPDFPDHVDQRIENAFLQVIGEPSNV
jgi:peptidoglycan L-alanyl-D-glutamate endopeptidase CwlK